MIEDSVKQTRIEIVASGLGLLLARANETVSRKQFFLIDDKFVQTGDIKKIQQVAKANSSKAWHSGVLERLISAGLIKKIGDATAISYQVDNFDKAMKAFQNFKSGDKLIVSHYVFPSEVQLNDNSTTTSEQIIETSELDQAPPIPVQVEMDASFLLGRILDNLIYMRREGDDFRSQFNKFEDGTLTFVTAIRNGVKEYTDSDIESNKILQTLTNKINGNTKSVDDLGSQIKSQHSLLEANQRTIKELLASTQGITNISDVVEATKTALLQISNIATKVESLTNEIKTKEANKLDSLAIKMKDQLNNLSVLQDEILTAFANLEGR